MRYGVREWRYLAKGMAGAALAAILTGCPAAVTSADGAALGQRLVIASASGARLHGWFAPGRPGGGAVLLLHGIGADHRSMLPRARFLHDSGYAVLLVDFQGQGESPGRASTYGALESRDARAALDSLRARAPGERVGVIGFSMGGAAALLGRGPLTADAFVLEAVYPTIQDAVRNRMRAWLGKVGPALAPLALWALPPVIGVGLDQLQPIERIGRLSAPLLLLAGTRDLYTPLAEARALFERADDAEEFWAVDGAAHEDFYTFAPREYERRIGAFLARHLRRAPDLLGQSVGAPAAREATRSGDLTRR